MQKVRTYINEAFQELLYKVTWPTWAELQSSAIVVMVASLIIALMIFAMDFLFQSALNLFYQMFA